MKKIKNIVMAAAVLAACGTAFAKNYTGVNAAKFESVPSPESYKSKATAGRFGSDVDDYMGVNDWSGIKPSKFFSFVGYNYNDGNEFNIGYATKVKKNYVGLYFGGQLDGLKMTSTFTTDDKKTAEKNSFSYNNEAAHNYTAAVLVGTEKGRGIKFSMLYEPKASSYNKPDMSEKEWSSNENYRLYGDLAVGLGDKNSKHFNIGLDATMNKATVAKGYNDNSTGDLYVGAGLTTNKGWDFDVDTRWRITPYITGQVDGKTNLSYGTTDNAIRATAAKGYKYNPTNALSLKAKVKFPVTLGFTADKDATKTGDGDWVYYNRTHKIDLGVEPSLALGAVYAVKPGKVDLNVGTKLNLGDLGWNIVNKGYRDDTSKATTDRSVTTITFGFDTDALNLEWKSGITCYFGKNFTFDCYYNIVGNLLNGMKSNDDTFKRNQSILDTANKVLVPTDGLKLMLTLKM